jgi:hypothetical protein
MRDASRIERITSILLKVWIKYPGLRLGQIVENAKSLGLPPSVCGHEPDTFYVEDDVILRLA